MDEVPVTEALRGRRLGNSTEFQGRRQEYYPDGSEE